MATLRNSLLVLLASSALFLVQTNPQRKADYIADASRRASSLLCECSSNSDLESVCETLSPLVKLSMKGALHLYTEEPKNFGLFSLFATQFPNLEIYSVGVGGQFFYIIHANEQWFVSSEITGGLTGHCVTAAAFLE